MNIQKIRKCFYQKKIWTKAELASVTQLSLASITNILQELLKSQEILFIGENDSTGGRKSKQYVLNKDYCHLLKVILKKQKDHDEVICIDVDLFNHIILKKHVSFLCLRQDELKNILIEIIQNDHFITMMSLSVPGVCHDGIVDVCDLKAFENKNLKAYIQTFYSHQIIIENDVNIASIGFSALYPNYQHMVLVYQPLVEYIGCGMMINGTLYNGFTHFAGELRYLPFYTLQQQDQLLKTNPMELLEKQLTTLCCVMNPEIIGICSDVIDDVSDIHLSGIPATHQPQIVDVEDLYPLIESGLYRMSMQKIMEEREDE